MDGRRQGVSTAQDRCPEGVITSRNLFAPPPYSVETKSRSGWRVIGM